MSGAKARRRRLAAEVGAAYERMADGAAYRPGLATGDTGHVTGALDLDAEKAAYAARWRQDEESSVFVIGAPADGLRSVAVFAVEAARACSGGSRELAFQLLQMAMDDTAGTG